MRNRTGDLVVGFGAQAARIVVVAAAVSILTGCGHPNYWAGFGVLIDRPAAETDPKKVDEVASGLGFEFIPNYYSRPSVVDLSGGKLESYDQLGRWEWSKRRSTVMTLVRRIPTNRYEVFFADYDTGGWDLKGEPCAKYLEFVSAMKSSFGPDRLKFESEDCKREDAEFGVHLSPNSEIPA